MALGFPLFLLCVAVVVVIIVVLVILFATGAFTAAAGGAVSLSAGNDEKKKGRKKAGKVLIAVGVIIALAVVGVVIWIVTGIINKITYSTNSMAVAARGENSTAVIKEYLDNGEHPDSYYSFFRGDYHTTGGKETPLTEICGLWGGDEHLATAQLLIRNGADVNYKGKNGTPLQLAVKYRYTKLTSLLINSGADLNVRDEDGRIPLMVSLEWEKTDSCLQMIKSGADVNAADDKGYPVMYYALAEDTDVSVIKALIEKGAAVDFTTPDNVPAICIAAMNSSAEVLEELKNTGIDLNRCDSYGANALIYAASEDMDTESVKWLIENGVDINGRGRNNTTPLLHLCENEMWVRNNAEILLDSGADINAVDGAGRNALVILAEKTFKASDIDTAFQLLCGRGIDVNKADNRGRTALMMVSREIILEDELTACINSLIESGADVNMKDNNGNTALMYASTAGNYRAVRLLLKNGADKSLTNNKGRTALDMAADGLSGNKGLTLNALEE